MKTAEEILTAFASHPVDKNLYDKVYVLAAMYAYAEQRTEDLRITNAKLIAAAPELLEALKNIVALNGVGYGTDVVQFVTDLQPFIIEAQHAIQKATL